MSTASTSADAPPRRVSIAFTFLNGVYFAASRTGKRWEPEWPPHFDRAFMALTAALYRRTRAPDDPEYTAERKALLTMERLPEPMIYAPPAGRLEYPNGFVPINHVKERRGSQVLTLLPSRRGKNKRYYPGFAIRADGAGVDPAAHFIWEGADAEAVLQHAGALGRLLRRVAYLGTSRSLVAAELCTDPPAPTHVPLRPVDQPLPSDCLIRVAGEGRLRTLNSHFEVRKQLEVPPVGIERRYRLVEPSRPPATNQPPPESAFGDMIVYRLVGRDWLPITHALLVARRFRELVLAHAGEAGRSPVVCGRGDEEKQCPPHVGWIPLANVGYDYSNGRILGVAVTLPRLFAFGTAGRDEVLRALAGLDGAAPEGVPRLLLGRLGCPEVRLVEGDSDRESLRPQRYAGWASSGTSRYWASVTPFVSECLGSRDYHGGRRLVRRACRRVGLPDPVDCALTRISPIRGVPPADHFLTQCETTDPACRCRHVVLDFGRPVRGPVLIGRYRYFGMGLCLPWIPPFTRERP
jgi:CRISPR-associated protein Csb2